MTERPLIGPMPPIPWHPTPWRVAEQRGSKHVVVDAEGSWVAEVPSEALASAIAAIVNAHDTSELRVVRGAEDPDAPNVPEWRKRQAAEHGSECSVQRSPWTSCTCERGAP